MAELVIVEGKILDVLHKAFHHNSFHEPAGRLIPPRATQPGRETAAAGSPEPRPAIAARSSCRHGLEAEIASGLPLVQADEDRIQQALGNLLNNAIKFTPAGGRILVVARREGDEIRFAVVDTGPGIATDHLPRVFDRFWQARSADRRGAGLGLAIAKGIVDAHGGHIHAESVPGEGSTFSFTLPVFRPAPDVQNENDQQSQHGGGRAGAHYRIAGSPG